MRTLLQIPLQKQQTRIAATLGEPPQPVKALQLQAGVANGAKTRAPMLAANSLQMQPETRIAAGVCPAVCAPVG